MNPGHGRMLEILAEPFGFELQDGSGNDEILNGFPGLVEQNENIDMLVTVGRWLD